ncbi:MAG: 30S ribosome-binding factor RbfA [Bacteriovoracaceae bacterium]|nr:30S ribosome-binding factor RbfA [Bacteriovoracaceae bacterium]
MNNRKNSFSHEKYQEQVLNTLNSFLRTEFKGSELTFVTVVKVELSPEYSHAKIFWDTFDSTKRGDCKAALEKYSGKLRQQLSKVLKVKHTPELHFLYNSQYEDELKIENLLKSSSDDSH